MGRDSAGNRLDDVMPRYQLTRADLDAVVAYLHTLGDERAPGVTDHAIRAGVILPPDGRAAGVRAAIEKWAADLNAGGGICGRTLEVHFGPEKDLFALFASFTEDAKPSDMPILSAFDRKPDLTAPNVRYLTAGIA